MKKITLLILTLFMSFVGYSQLSENFDSGTALPTDWVAFANGTGVATNPTRWGVVSSAAQASTPPNALRTLYYAITNTTTTVATGQEWVATKQINVPSAAQLQFNVKKVNAQLDPGQTFQIWIANGDNPANQTNPAAYTLKQEWLVDEISDTPTAYVQKTIDLSSYAANSKIFIAFVRLTQRPPNLTAVVSGILIDDVEVAQKCQVPTALSVLPNIGLTSANLYWTTPGGTAAWDIVIVRESETFESGTVMRLPATQTTVSAANPYNATQTAPGVPLLPGTDYKYYVRAVCSETNKSVWSSPSYFTTAGLGETCADPFVIPRIPYSLTDNTFNSADRYDAGQGTGACGVTGGGNYTAGNDMFYIFTAPTSGSIRIKMTPNTINSGMFVYAGCTTPTLGPCLAGVANATANPRIIPSFPVVAGQSYIILLSSAAPTTSFGYDLELQYVFCDPPVSLNAVPTRTDATLTWANPTTFAATSWEVAVQTAGSVIPAGAGFTVNTNPTVSAQAAFGGPLQEGTNYQFWVRANCGDGSFSRWEGPFVFFTPFCDAPNFCAHNFQLRGTAGWQGAVMHVRQNGVTVKVLGPQFVTGTSLNVPVDLCTGIPFELVWVSPGLAPATVAITVTNSFNQTLLVKNANATDLPSTTPILTEMVDCLFPKCLPPTAPMALTAAPNQPTATSAKLTWTPAPPVVAIDTWEIDVRLATAAAPLNTEAVDPNREYTGDIPFDTDLDGGLTLFSDTQYRFYVRKICGDKKSDWVPSTVFTTAVSCPVPNASSMTVSNIQRNQADFSWTQSSLPGTTAPPAPTAWEVIVVTAGSPAPDPSVSGRRTTLRTNFPYTGLASGTAYQYYVRAECSPTDFSRWSGPTSFVTLCDPINVPYTETFNTTSNTKLCWSAKSIGPGANTWMIDNPAGTQYAAFDPNKGANNNDWLISPDMVLPPAASGLYRLKFKYRVENATGVDAPNTIEVRLSTTGSDPAVAGTYSNILLAPTTWSNTAYAERILNLDAYAGSTVNVAWHVPSGAQNRNKIYIDDVVFERLADCPEPSELTAGTITATTAVLSWVPGFNESEWQVVVQTQGGPVPPGNYTGPTVANNYTAGPLLADTNYEYYVRAYCSATSQSIWSGPFRFRTLRCNVEDTCQWSFVMTDRGLNGWGSTMDVIQNGNVIATLTGPANNVASATTTVTLCAGVNFQLRWNASTVVNAGEVGITILNASNEVVYSKLPGRGRPETILFQTDAISCNAISCPAPTNLLVEQTSGTSVLLKWTPGGTETRWAYKYQEVGGSYPLETDGNIVTTPRAVVQNLTQGIKYEYFVRALCSDTNKSFWQGPFPFTIYNSPFCLSVDITGVSTSIGEEKELCADVNGDYCANLSATYYQTRGTESYTVSSIAYAPPFPFSGGEGSVSITTDDRWSPLINMTPNGSIQDFNFCFYGNVYNKLLLTDNGAITFSIAGPGGNGGRYTPDTGSGFAFTQTIPNTPVGQALPYINSIFGVLQDTWPARSPSDFSINYEVLGTYPCRAFVFNIYKLAAYGTQCTTQLQTNQVVLYEGSNIIDVYVESRTPCPSHNSGSGLIGIQGTLTGQALAAPGRNTGAWTATNEAWRFTPSGALSDVQFEWRKAGAFYSNSTNINVCVDDVTLMEAVAVYAKCDPTLPRETRTAEVTLIPVKIEGQNPEDLEACIGSGTQFSLTDNDAVILAGVADPQNYTIQYFLTRPEAEVGTSGAITTYTPTVTTPIFVRIDKGSCFEIRTFNLIPDVPLPDYTLDTQDNIATICSGVGTALEVTPINFAVADATYEWMLPDATISPETSNILTIPAGLAEATYTYTVKVTSDAGCETIKTFVLTVDNQIPVVEFNYPDATVCVGSANPVAVPDLDPLSTAGTFSVPSGSPLVFANAATGEIDMTLTPPGTYRVTFEVAASTCNALTSDFFDITITPLAAPVTGFSYNNAVVCVNGTVVPTLQQSTGFTQNGTFSVTPATGLIVDPTTGAVTINSSTVPGDYDVVYTFAGDPANCIDAGDSSLTPVRITVNNGVTLDSFFEYKTTFCKNEGLVSPLPTSTFDAGGQFTVNPTSGLVINATTGQIDVTASEAGSYEVTYLITADASTCRAESKTVKTVVISADFDVNIDNDCVNANYILTATPNDTNYNYVWKNAAGVDVGTNSPTFNVTEYANNNPGQVYPLQFTVTVDNNGCDVTESFSVPNIACNIPKGISPNGDGANDEFDLTGFNVRKLEIFNRYGKRVNSFTNYRKEWHGQADNGNELPDGTYYYVIEREGVKTVSGWVQINRQRN